MKERYRAYRRENGIFYSIDTVTNQRHSLETSNPAAARRIINAKNEACQQPAIQPPNRQSIFGSKADPRFIQRNWAEVMIEFVKNQNRHKSNSIRASCPGQSVPIPSESWS